VVRTERPRRSGADDAPPLPERLAAPAIMLPPAPPPAAPLHVAPPSPSSPAPPAPAEHPALAIASERLGEVAVRLSGGPEQLQVVMQAQPAAAALIGAEAPRLSQDLAAAGVALAGLSVNGQRADLSGGQRERQRPAPRRDVAAPIVAARRPITRQTIDRFA
jgi:hypothetical protein